MFAGGVRGSTNGGTISVAKERVVVKCAGESGSRHHSRLALHGHVGRRRPQVQIPRSSS